MITAKRHLCQAGQSQYRAGASDIESTAGLLPIQRISWKKFLPIPARADETWARCRRRRERSAGHALRQPRPGHLRQQSTDAAKRMLHRVCAYLVCRPVNNLNYMSQKVVLSSLILLPRKPGFYIPSPPGRGVGVRVIISKTIIGTVHWMPIPAPNACPSTVIAIRSAP
jgi:hypothetical protein